MTPGISGRLLSLPRLVPLAFILILIEPEHAVGARPKEFWMSIREHGFAVPAGQSVSNLALELVDLAGETDPELRDNGGYEILAAWVYRQNLLTGDQLEALRKKILPGMTFHIGESDNATVFRRSFSALYLSILAAHDLQHSFLSDEGFQQTLDAALRCYSQERDLRGYVPNNGWAHATAHVADLLKFLSRNQRLSAGDQKRIVEAIAERCRTAGIVFVWGEDARMAAALLSIVNRKDFDPAPFNAWFEAVTAENKKVWEAPKLDTAAYVRVRTQANMFAQLVARISAKDPNDVPAAFRANLAKVTSELNQ